MGKVLDQVLHFKNKYHGGISWRVRKHAEVLDGYVDKDEKVLYSFVAQKNDSFKEIFNTFAIAITDKRILLGHKRLFWGSFFYTITPDMYNDMEIYRGLIWGKIIIDTVKEVVVLTNLPKNSLDEIETNISNFMIDAKKYYKNEKQDE